MLRKSTLSLLLCFLSFTATATDCDVKSFHTLAGYVNLTVKAKVIALPELNYFYEIHQEHERYYVFLITKRYYGFELRDTIRVDTRTSWDTPSRLMGYPITIDDYKLNEEALLNLYAAGDHYQFGNCGEYELEFKNDSVYSDMKMHPSYSLKDYEQQLIDRYGVFVQQPYRMVKYGDPEFMEPVQHSATQGEFRLKATLPDGAYFVYTHYDEGFVLVEEAYLQHQHYIGRYKSYYLNGRRKAQTCYTKEGLLDDYYIEYYNNEDQVQKDFMDYDNGELTYKLCDWPNGGIHEVIYYGKDTSEVWVRNEAGQIEFKGIEINGKRIGEYTIYEGGALYQQYYTDENGIQGYYIHYQPDSRLVVLFPYKDGLLQGKGLRVDWANSPPLKFSKGVITSTTRYKIIKEMNFKDGLLDGPQTTYLPKKQTQIEYYEMGIYKKCDGCFEF